jgi:hypothetical protein
MVQLFVQVFKHGISTNFVNLRFEKQINITIIFIDSVLNTGSFFIYNLLIFYDNKVFIFKGNNVKL